MQSLGLYTALKEEFQRPVQFQTPLLVSHPLLIFVEELSFYICIAENCKLIVSSVRLGTLNYWIKNEFVIQIYYFIDTINCK